MTVTSKSYWQRCLMWVVRIAVVVQRGGQDVQLNPSMWFCSYVLVRTRLIVNIWSWYCNCSSAREETDSDLDSCLVFVQHVICLSDIQRRPKNRSDANSVNMFLSCIQLARAYILPTMISPSTFISGRLFAAWSVLQVLPWQSRSIPLSTPCLPIPLQSWNYSLRSCLERIRELIRD